MNKVPALISTMATGATVTASFVVGMRDQVLLQIPAVVANFTSGVITASLLGSYQSGVTAQTMYYYNYVSGNPSECLVTISTGGVYEMPHPGSAEVLKIKFDVATTQAVNVGIMTPKTTF
jgi:hypothetical protein